MTQTHTKTISVARVLLIMALLLCATQCTRSEETRHDRAITEHRKGMLTIEAEPGTSVHVEQLRHEFWFGAAIASQVFHPNADPADVAQYKRVFLENFNSAVTENALKWMQMERRQGQVDTSIVDAILAWTDENDIPLRGHCIYWGIPNRVAPWQKTLSDEQLLETIKNRGITIGRRYQGRFAQYDLNNEMIHANYYEDRLGPGITRKMADWVKEGDPNAVLCVNDYDVLTGNRLDDYVAHIRGLLQQGVRIGGVGVQGHLHAESFDPAVLENALATLAQFELPICITEFNLPGQRSRFAKDRNLQLTATEEQAKARALVAYYRICFAQPAVKGILMWGFWEGRNWIPASSLYRRDWTPTPAADAYRDLVFREWWTDWQGVMDSTGSCEIPAFYGTYRIRVGEQEETINLSSDEQTKKVTVR